MTKGWFMFIHVESRITNLFRFQRHEQFPFLVFGVCQKRQVCRSVTLQMKKSSFKKYEALLAKLKPEDFRQASKEEFEKKPYSNEGIRILRKNIRAVRGRIQGTDEACLSMRSKVWSTILLFNPSSLWITINPANTQDPITQVLAGMDISAKFQDRTVKNVPAISQEIPMRPPSFSIS